MACLFLFLCFLSLPLNFLLLVEFPQLGVNLLLHYVLLHLTSLVNELLLSFDLAPVVLEPGLVESQVVISSSKSLLESPVDLVRPLLNSLLLELVETDSHLLSDLLGSFQVLHELLLKHHVLLLEQGGQLGSSLVEVALLSPLHVLQSVSNQVLLDNVFGLGLPVGLVEQVSVTSDIIIQSSQVLHKSAD